MDNDLFAKIFSAATAAWAAVCMAAVALFKAWPAIMSRLNERHRDIAAERAGDWDRIRSERDLACEERDLVRDRWAACEAEILEWKARAITAEAYQLGVGMGRNEATTILAAERLIQNGHRKPEVGDGE